MLYADYKQRDGYRVRFAGGGSSDGLLAQCLQQLVDVTPCRLARDRTSETPGIESHFLGHEHEGEDAREQRDPYVSLEMVAGSGVVDLQPLRRDQDTLPPLIQPGYCVVGDQLIAGPLRPVIQYLPEIRAGGEIPYRPSSHRHLHTSFQTHYARNRPRGHARKSAWGRGVTPGNRPGAVQRCPSPWAPVT